MEATFFVHSGVLGMKWGQRQYQYEDGSLTPMGREHYDVGPPREKKSEDETKTNNTSTKSDNESANNSTSSKSDGSDSRTSKAETRKAEKEAYKEYLKEIKKEHKEATRKMIADAKNIRAYSISDIQEKINKIQKENELRKITEQTLHPARAMMTDIMKEVGKEGLSSATKYLISSSLEGNFDVRDLGANLFSGNKSITNKYAQAEAAKAEAAAKEKANADKAEASVKEKANSNVNTSKTDATKSTVKEESKSKQPDKTEPVKEEKAASTERKKWFGRKESEDKVTTSEGDNSSKKSGGSKYLNADGSLTERGKKAIASSNAEKTYASKMEGQMRSMRANGKSYSEIANLLGISPTTVYAHIGGEKNSKVPTVSPEIGKLFKAHPSNQPAPEVTPNKNTHARTYKGKKIGYGTKPAAAPKTYNFRVRETIGPGKPEPEKYSWVNSGYNGDYVDTYQRYLDKKAKQRRKMSMITGIK